MPKSQRDELLAHAEAGLPVPHPEQAALGVAVARRQARRAYLHLPFHLAVALAFGVGGYLYGRTSAAFAAPFFMALVAFVGFFWWRDTVLVRRRAVAANMALLGGEAPPSRPPARGGFMAMASVAWAVTLFVNGILVLLGAPGWLGLPIFVANLFLF